MLAWRLVLGPLLIAALIGLFVLDAQSGPAAPYLWALGVVLGIRSVWEMTSLLRTRELRPNFPLVAIGAVAIITANWWPHIASALCETTGLPGLGEGASAANPNGLVLPAGPWRLGPAMLVFSVAVMVLFVNRAARYEVPGTAIITLGAEVLTLSYVAVFASSTAQLRWVADEAVIYLPLGSLVIATKSGDIAAYAGGRLFGRTKLVPKLSPGKTWEGVLGAIVGSLLGTWAWFHYGTHYALGQTRYDLACVLGYGAVLGIVGVVGDLCESLIKRDGGHKDSARLLPGFGGLLDLLDSVLFTGPVAYLLWMLVPLLGRP